MNTETATINYCNQNLVFDNNALAEFKKYEAELKNHFSQMHDGDEIYHDLQFRICEILQSKMERNQGIIVSEHIDELKESIGNVHEFSNDEENKEYEPVNKTEHKEEKRKLFRDNNSKVLGGVAAGLGNYFALDPIVFRLLFVLLAFSSMGISIIFYIILWAVLPSANLPANLSKRFYRSSSDALLAGVCGGLARFFNIESWIIRVIFLAPVLLNFVGMFSLQIFGLGIVGISLITYFILWIATKKDETPIEKMLSKGQDVNINSITSQYQQNEIAHTAKSGFKTLLRIVAIFFIVIFLIALTVFLFVFSIISVLMYTLTSAIFKATIFKVLGVLSVVLFIILPIIALMVWLIRRLGNYKSPNKALRLGFGSLWIVGLICTISLAFYIFSSFRTEAEIVNKVNLMVNSDTLFLHNLEEDINFINLPFNGLIPHVFDNSDNEQKSLLVSYRTKESPNDSFYLETKLYSFGENISDANKNASQTIFRTELQENHLYLSKYLQIPKQYPFRGQHIKATIYVPKGKHLISDLEKDNWNHMGKFGYLKINDDSLVIRGDELELFADDEGIEIKRKENAEDDPALELNREKDKMDLKIEIEKQKLKLKEEENALRLLKDSLRSLR